MINNILTRFMKINFELLINNKYLEGHDDIQFSYTIYETNL